ncbi:hypothetical protein JCM11641_004154 [Rhodosporidiobolus odoratus]
MPRASDTGDVSSVALPRQQAAPADTSSDDGDDSSPTLSSAAVSFTSPSAPDVTATSSTVDDDEDATSVQSIPSTSSSSVRITTRPQRATPTLADLVTSNADASTSSVINLPLTLPSALASTLPLGLSLTSALPLDASTSTLPAAPQGFSTSIRRPFPLPAPTGTRSTPTSDAAHPHKSVSEAAARANATGMFTGISLAALVLVLVLLVSAPKIKSMCCGRRRKDKTPDQTWTPGGTAATFKKRTEKDDDEVSWFSGSTADGGLNEKDEKYGSSSSCTVVEYSNGHELSKENLAGIGRRNTLKSLRKASQDYEPPQAEFVTYPRTPTIIYSPPPNEPAPPLPTFSPPRRILTPQGFPSTPSAHSLASGVGRTAQPLPPMPTGQYAPSTPPLGSLYTEGQWQRILHSPPILSPPSAVGSPSYPSPHHLHHDYHHQQQQHQVRERTPSPLQYDDDDASIYSRPSMMLPAPPPLAAAQRPPLPLLPVRLEGLAAAAARSRAMSTVGGAESFPATPTTEYTDESVVGWKRG